MTDVLVPTLVAYDADALAAQTGRIVLLADGTAPSTAGARKVDRLTRGAVKRLMEGEARAKVKPGERMELAYPAGLAAEAVQILRLPRRADAAEARKAGGAIAKARGKGATLVLAEGHPRQPDLILGLNLRAYDFDLYKSGEKKERGPVTLMVSDVAAAKVALASANRAGGRHLLHA